jgi:hypothetical protein
MRLFYNTTKPAFLLTMIYFMAAPVCSAQGNTPTITQPQFNYHPASVTHFKVKQLPLRYNPAAMKHYVEKPAKASPLKFNSAALTINTMQTTEYHRGNDILASFLSGYASGFPQTINTYTPNTSVYSSKSNIIGFALGFISSGIVGPLLYKNHNNGNIPPLYNDFTGLFRK